MQTKTILITGCSSGIGLCAATLLKQRGYRVFAAARKAQDVLNLQNQGFESVQLDVNDSHSIAEAAAQVLTRCEGKLYGLFNNAGYIQVGAVEDVTREQIRAQFETNVFGSIELIRHILPAMRQQGEGRIIQNSSILGVLTLPYYGAYNASKFAVEGFMRTLRQELHGTSIYAALINPGPITSKLRENAYSHYSDTVAQSQTETHKTAYSNMQKNYFNSEKAHFTAGPESVINKLIHALESPRPKIHYYVGWPIQSLAFIQRLLPEKVMDWLLARIK